MAANRCRKCLTSWPSYPTYAVCPECLERCDPMATAQAITVAEAESRARHAKFDREYEKHDAERDGPSPEELGREEAKRLAAEWRKLEEWVSG
jgi:hypothetical protein